MSLPVSAVHAEPHASSPIVYMPHAAMFWCRGSSLRMPTVNTASNTAATRANPICPMRNPCNPDSVEAIDVPIRDPAHAGPYLGNCMHLR